MIYLLDTTLRDGGYIIDWNFGEKRISLIVSNLRRAQIDFIELGFLSKTAYNPDLTLFNSISDAQKFVCANEEKFCVMIKSGEFDIKNLSSADKYKIKKIRYIFKKNSLENACKECENLIQKGFSVFVNPVFIDDYNEEEYFELMEKINLLNPYGISVVDSMGTMNEIRIENIFLKLDKILNKNISLCYHAHNNTERAYLSSKKLVDLNMERNIIIDTALSGMGRGAGNVCTELLAQYLNEKLNKNYKVSYLDKIIDECLSKFYEKTPWGNSYPYYIAGVLGCHCEYVNYLLKKDFETKEIVNMLSQIPKQEKTKFNKKIIEKYMRI